MHIKTIEALFVIIVGLLMSINDSKRVRLIYIVLCSIVLLIVASFRSPEWMTNTYQVDTIVYMGYFEHACDMNWRELGVALQDRYVRGTGDFDIGYLLLCRIIGLFTTDFYIFSLIADLLFFVPFGIMLYRYSTSIKQLIFAFVFYLALMQTYFIGGSRQMFAIGFDLMSFLAILDKKRVLAIVFFLLGISIHFSSLLFILPLLIMWFNPKARTLKALHFILFLFVPIVLAIPNEIILFMSNIVGMDKYSSYGMHDVRGGAVTFIALMEFLSFFCLIAIKITDLKGNRILRSFYAMVPLFTFFAPLIRSNGTMDRIALNFYLYLVIIVPFACDCLVKRKRLNTTVYAVIIGALSLLIILKDSFVYYFYWQL